MKISELSRQSGVPQATIKYYIRAGLLAPGTKTARNQAQYPEQHLDRLKLIRALREVGGLSVETVRSLFEALAETPSLQVAAMAHDSLSPRRPAAKRDADWSAAEQELADFLAGLGWQIYRGSTTFEHLVDVYVAMKQAWPAELRPTEVTIDSLRHYAEAAHQIASFDLGGDDVDVTQLRPEDQLRWVVLGTVLLEPLLLALRRVAHQDLGTKRWAQRIAQDASE